jgi:shikimate kinase
MVGERPDVVVLIGMMGSGKSTIGRLVADRLGTPFCDTDEQVVRETGMSIDEIFSTYGENVFRDHESQALEHCLELGGIVATGGGIVLRDTNRTMLMESNVRVVWLDASPDELIGRLSGVRDRPMLGNNPQEAILRLDDQRRPAYAQVASVRIDTTEKSPNDVCEEIATWIGVAQ